MHRNYSDITSLTDDPPKWHDENGVPRYCDFHPGRLANIYSGEAALALIECQGCRTPFKVAFSELNLRHELWDESKKTRIAFLSDLITNGSLHYGDPPNTQCCATGATMNSIPIAVLEYWFKPYAKETQPGDVITDLSKMNWTRDPDFEVPIVREKP